MIFYYLFIFYASGHFSFILHSYLLLIGLYNHSIAVTNTIILSYAKHVFLHFSLPLAHNFVCVIKSVPQAKGLYGNIKLFGAVRFHLQGYKLIIVVLKVVTYDLLTGLPVHTRKYEA